MAKKGDMNDNLFCSFCGKNQKEVTKLIAGPAVYICDECIQLCSEIIDEESEKATGETEQILAPKEITAMLDDYVIEQDKISLPRRTIFFESFLLSQVFLKHFKLCIHFFSTNLVKIFLKS